jgi:hypothetical protein
MRFRSSWTSRSLAGLGVLGSFSGCAGGLVDWRRSDASGPLTYPPHQQVQVWHGGRADVWHGVRWSATSLSGIPYHRQLECAKCRVSLPAAAIDSLRLGNLESAGLIIGAAPFVAAAAVAIAMRLGWGSD